MFHRRSAATVTGLTLGLAMFFAVPATAVTEQTQELKLSGDPHVTASSPLTLKAKKIASGTLTLACFDFTFTGDLVDPGDELILSPDGVGDYGGGFSAGSEPIATRTICFNDPVFLADVADGNSSEQFTVRANPSVGSGPFTVSSVTMRLTYA
ncbi:hypothetical protein J2W14_004123 [Pseudarthrobacter oxydans]|uniref:hypothetical protein n=1 Tax=Pseudarthrobacter oxydans TaxID=1671 RepID=UPI002782FB77|nr:hypothetical protein [Pseudarthrobacter oxydans]MDP9984696.1 hypothetical protein [Pseudarthrobacter oxydans]